MNLNKTGGFGDSAISVWWSLVIWTIRGCLFDMESGLAVLSDVNEFVNSREPSQPRCGATSGCPLR